MIRMNALHCLIWIVALTTTLPAQSVEINEFFTGTPDAVELLNRSLAPVDVSGWMVQTYWTTTGGGAIPVSDGVFVIPAGTVLAVGGILVLEENGTLGAPGGAYPNAIQTGFNYNWTSSTAVEVALTDPTGAGVDYVYRIANNGGATSPHLPPGIGWGGSLTATGNEVWRSGDVDTDNAADWTVQSPNTLGTVNPGQTLPNPVVLSVDTTGVGDVTLGVVTMPPAPGAQIFNLISLTNYTPDGSGPLFGVGFDVLPQVATPKSAANPFHTCLDAAGTYTLSLPAGSLPPGLLLEAVTLVVEGGAVTRISCVDETVF